MGEPCTIVTHGIPRIPAFMHACAVDLPSRVQLCTEPSVRGVCLAVLMPAADLQNSLTGCMLTCRRVAMLAVAGILMVEAVGNGPWWTAPFRV